MGAHLKQAGVKAPIYRETKRVVGNISVLWQKVFSSCDKIYFLLGEERKYFFTEKKLAKNCEQSPQSSKGTLQCHLLWTGCGKCRDCRELKSTSPLLTNTLDQTAQTSSNVIIIINIIIIAILMLVIYWDWPMCILVQPTNPCQRTLLTRGPERQLPNLWITVAIIVLIIVLILCSHHFSYPCPHLCSHSHTRPRSNNTFQILMGRGYPFPHTHAHT